MSDDTISRAAALDGLSKLRMIDTYKIDGDPCLKVKAIDVYEMLKQLPSAQPELIEQSAYVRCKDCKWYEGDIMGNPWGVCCHPSWVDGNSGHEVSEKGWCYRAERREE